VATCSGAVAAVDELPKVQSNSASLFTPTAAILWSCRVSDWEERKTRQREEWKTKRGWTDEFQLYRIEI
jgi:hypothetical protein